jgi:hypothetical protein
MKKLRSALYLSLVPVLCYCLGGCFGGGGGPQAIVVDISSAPFAGSAIDQGQTLTLTAKVTNDMNAAGVSWTLTQGGVACSPGCGQLLNSSTTQTTYNAPNAGNAAIQVTITGTSVADGTKHHDFALTITLKPSVNAQNLAQGTAGVAYGPQQVVETGGAGTLTWAITGVLPAALTGLTINSSTGMVSGTPAGPAGTFSFTVQVTDSGNPTIQGSGLITIKLVLPPAPTITSTSPLPAATVGVVYPTFTFVAAGVGPFTWAAAPPLTNGLTFNANGTVTGTPTAPPTTLNFNVTVTDKFGQSSAATPFKVVISFPPPPTITSTSPLNPAGTIGAAYNFTFVANGAGPFTWAAAPPLTNGLTFNVNGTITGTPTAPATTLNFNVTVTDKFGQSSAATPFALVISAAAAVTINITLQPASPLAENASTSVTAHVGNDPLNKGVDWSFVCGGGNCGSITLHTASDAPATFMAPPTVPPAAVVITAAATADNTKTANANAVTITSSNPNDAKLNGNYAFEVAAWDNFNAFSPGGIGGTFVADGNGNLTSGVIDRSLTSTVATNTAFTGTYNIGNDSRGTLTITFAGGLATYTIRFALQANGNAKIIAFGNTPNTNFQGSGVIKKQDTTAFLLTKITGDYVLGIEGVTLINNNRSAAAGRFTSDGAGSVNTGTVDISGPSSSSGALTLGGNIAAPDAVTGRGTLVFNATGQNAVNLAYYVVSADELLVLDIDTVSRILYTGTIVRQHRPSGGFTLGSFNTTVVFEFTGYDVSSTQSNTGVGFITADGAGNVPSGFLDENADGTFASNALPAGSTYTIDADGNGRGILKLTGVHEQVLYFGDVNKAIFLEGTPADVGKDATLGIAEPQSAGITSASFTGNYAFGTGHPVTPFVQDFSGEATATGATGTFAATEDITLGQGGPANIPDVPLNATYQFTAGKNGRATVTITPQGAAPVHYVFWFVSPSKGVGVAADAANTNSAIVIVEK